MNKQPQSAIKPSLRNEIMADSSKPRQMNDGNVAIQILSNNETYSESTSTTITSHNESMSSASTGGVLLSVDPNTGMAAPKSPSSLKRSSSWKKFKNTVKETVSGIVQLSVGQSPSSTEGLIENTAKSKSPLHLCENLTPDVEEKLVHCSSTEDIFQPHMEEEPSAFERLERQADAAFAAAANYRPPIQSTPLMVTLPPTIQSHAPRQLNKYQTPQTMVATVPQIVVTSDIPEERQELRMAEMSAPRKILKNVDQNRNTDNLNVASKNSPNDQNMLTDSNDKSSPLRFSNSMTNIPSLSNKKRVSWGEFPPEILPDTESDPPAPKNDATHTESNSDSAIDEEKKRAARLKIKNALLGAVASSAGNNNLQCLMQPHFDAPKPVPIQTSSSSSNLGKADINSGSLPQQSTKMPIRIRRSSECIGPEDNLLSQSPRSSNMMGAKIGRSSSMRKAKPKPMIWEHFDIVPNNSLQGRCKVCHMTISCKHNTGQFVRHLQLAHMDVFRKYENKIQTEWTKSIVQKTTAKQ